MPFIVSFPDPTLWIGGWERDYTIHWLMTRDLFTINNNRNMWPSGAAAKRRWGCQERALSAERTLDNRNITANMAWRLLILTVLILSRWSYEAQGQESKYSWLEIQKIYYSLQQQKAKSLKRSTTITELVVVWSLCSAYTSVSTSKAVILYNTSRFLL